MADAPDVEIGLARLLGGVQEAERLGSRTVGTEHLLMATLSDPAIRWSAKHVGHDLRAFQTAVDAVSAEREPTRTGGPLLTARARAVLRSVLDDVPTLSEPSGVTPRDISVALMRTLGHLLDGEKSSGAARALAIVGVRDDPANWLGMVEARAGRSSGPGRLSWF